MPEPARQAPEIGVGGGVHAYEDVGDEAEEEEIDELEEYDDLDDTAEAA